MRHAKIEDLNKELETLLGREQELESLIAEASSVRQMNVLRPRIRWITKKKNRTNVRIC